MKKTKLTALAFLILRDYCEDDILCIISQLNKKSCEQDPIPFQLFLKCIDGRYAKKNRKVRTRSQINDQLYTAAKATTCNGSSSRTRQPKQPHSATKATARGAAANARGRITFLTFYIINNF